MMTPSASGMRQLARSCACIQATAPPSPARRTSPTASASPPPAGTAAPRVSGGRRADRFPRRKLPRLQGVFPVVGDALEAELLVTGDGAAVVRLDVQADAFDSGAQQLLAQPGRDGRGQPLTARLG